MRKLRRARSSCESRVNPRASSSPPPGPTFRIAHDTYRQRSDGLSARPPSLRVPPVGPQNPVRIGRMEFCTPTAAPVRRRPSAWAPNLRTPRARARFRPVLDRRGAPSRPLRHGDSEKVIKELLSSPSRVSEGRGFESLLPLQLRHPLAKKRRVTGLKSPISSPCGGGGGGRPERSSALDLKPTPRWPKPRSRGSSASNSATRSGRKSDDRFPQRNSR